MHTNGEKSLFVNNIEVISQSIRMLQYSTKFGEDIDFNNIDNLDIDYSYEILNHKKDVRDHIVALDFFIKEKTEIETKIPNQLNIIIECHYKVKENIEEKDISEIKHFASLSLAVNFLRTVIFNFTSMTKNGGYYIPLINITHLHSKRITNKNKKIKK